MEQRVCVRAFYLLPFHLRAQAMNRYMGLFDMAAIHATCAALQHIVSGAASGEEAQRIARECIECLRKTSVDESRRLTFGSAEERARVPLTVTTVTTAKTPHPTTELRHPPTGQMVEIDERLVPLIDALWRAGIDTRHCCQGNPGSLQYMAYIEFTSAHAIDFVAAAINTCGGQNLRRWASGLAMNATVFESKLSVAELSTLIERPFILELDACAYNATEALPVTVSATLRFATNGIEELTEAVVLYAEQWQRRENGKK